MTQQFVPYAGVPVGDLVLELANDFDREYAVRRRLVNAIYHLRDVNLDGGFLSAICREMRFVKVCTRDVRRETAIVLHTQYDHIIKRLVYGKTIERDPVMLFLVEPLAQQLRAEWIGCSSLAEPLGELVDILRRAVPGYNIALIANWLLLDPAKIIGELGRMDNLNLRSIQSDLYHVSMHATAEANAIMFDEFEPALPSVVSAAQYWPLLSFTVNPPRQMIGSITAERMSVAIETGGIITVPIPDPEPGYKVSDGGVLVPER